MTDDARRLGLNLRYDCEASALPATLAKRFVRLDLGQEGEEYVKSAFDTRPGRIKTTLHRTLRTLMSDFDANGLLDMYPMHLLGTSQWHDLLGDTGGQRHLDVGAGAGEVTRTLSPLMGETVTTETSRVMARSLRRKGYRCYEVDVAETDVPEPRYDLVTCLNVIDRCARPLSLLERLTTALAPGGRLVIATPFPFNPFVYDGATSLSPKERLEMPNAGWEQSVTRLSEAVLAPLGLEIETVSRVPYLCRGDADQPIYVLDDALLVCRKPTSRNISSEHPDGGTFSKSVQSG